MDLYDLQPLFPPEVTLCNIWISFSFQGCSWCNTGLLVVAPGLGFWGGGVFFVESRYGRKCCGKCKKIQIDKYLNEATISSYYPLSETHPFIWACCLLLYNPTKYPTSHTFIQSCMWKCALTCFHLSFRTFTAIITKASIFMLWSCLERESRSLSDTERRDVHYNVGFSKNSQSCSFYGKLCSLLPRARLVGFGFGVMVWSSCEDRLDVKSICISATLHHIGL